MSNEARLFEILNGKSRLLPEKGGVFFYKHPTLFELEMSSELEEKYFVRAKKNGMLTEEELLASAETNGGWSDQNELEMKQLCRVLAKQEIALKKVSGEPSLVGSLMNSIKETKSEYEDLKIKREALTRYSLEDYVSRKVNTETFKRFLFSDENCKDELGDHELENVIDTFIEKYNNLTDRDKTLNLCYSPSFFEMFMLSSEDPLKILNKDFFSITVFQKNLLVYSNILRKKIDNIPDIPQNVLHDPIQLFDYDPNTKNVEENFNMRRHVEMHGGEENLKPEDMAT